MPCTFTLTAEGRGVSWSQEGGTASVQGRTQQPCSTPACPCRLCHERLTPLTC